MNFDKRVLMIGRCLGLSLEARRRQVSSGTERMIRIAMRTERPREVDGPWGSDIQNGHSSACNFPFGDDAQTEVQKTTC